MELGIKGKGKQTFRAINIPSFPFLKFCRLPARGILPLHIRIHQTQRISMLKHPLTVPSMVIIPDVPICPPQPHRGPMQLSPHVRAVEEMILLRYVNVLVLSPA